MGCGASKSSVVNSAGSNTEGKRDDSGTHVTSDGKLLQLEDASTIEEYGYSSPSPKNVQKEVSNDVQTTEVVQQFVYDQADSSIVTEVTSSQEKFAAFDVPLSREAKSPPNRFPDKSEKLSKTELAQKLKEKQQAAAARKEEELKKRANVSSRVSMKDRLRKEIMESRKLEEAALLEPETATEEDDVTPVDEIERDMFFNENPDVGEF